MGNAARFMVGEMLVLDGQDNVYVCGHFPEGSTAYAFPHVIVQRTPVRPPRGYLPERFIVSADRVLRPARFVEDDYYPFSDAELASLRGCS